MFLEICLGLLAIWLFFFIKSMRYTRGMPPGEFGWPLVGYSISSDESLFDQIEKMKLKHGNTFTMKFGSRYFIFLCDYRTIKSTFSTVVASHRPRVFSLDFFSDFKRLGFANNVGQSIQNLRRFTLTFLRNAGMGKSSMESIIVYELEYLIEDFKKYTGRPLEIPWSLNVAVINVLWKLLADKRFDIADSEMQRFQQLITAIFNDAQHPLVFLFDTYPLLSKLTPQFLHKKLGLAGAYQRWEEIQTFMRNSIDDHKKSIDKEHPRDYIDSFLLEMKAKEDGPETEKNFNFTYKELLYSLTDMFSAGSETTSSTIRWIILYLTKYPEVQKKVQKEIDSVLPKDRLPTYTDKEKLVYTQAMINEVLRLSPIAPFGLSHSVSEDFVIDGFHIPKDIILVPSVLSCHLDPAYFEDPEKFIPERFIREDGTLDLNKEGFTPFLTGRRACIGEALARMQLFFFITGLLQKFSFAAPEGVELSTKRDPKQPFFLIPPAFEIIITERK